MSLPKDVKKDFDEFYENLSEELHVFYVNLKVQGFSSDDAIKIMTAILNRPERLINNKRRAIERNEMLKNLRKSKLQFPKDDDSEKED